MSDLTDWLRDNRERIHDEAEQTIQFLGEVASRGEVCTELTCPHHGEANRARQAETIAAMRTAAQASPLCYCGKPKDEHPPGPPCSPRPTRRTFA